MPTFSVRIVNSDFASSNSVDAPDPEAARSAALKGALQIGAEEVCQGSPFFGAEISIESGDQVVERLMVAIGVSKLQLAEPASKAVEP